MKQKGLIRFLWLGVLFAFLSAASCQRTLFFAYYGIKNPKLETKESVRRYVEKHLKDSIPPLLFFKKAKDLKAFEKTGLRLNDIYFFNREGAYINHITDTTVCGNANLQKVLDNPHILDSIMPDSVIHIDRINPLLTDEQGRENPVQTANAKYTVVISFVKYTGRMNNKNQFHWVKVLRRYPDIQIYLLNYDFLKEWGISEDQLPKIK